MILLGIFIGIIATILIIIIKEFIEAEHTYDLKTQRIIMQKEFSDLLLANDRTLWGKYTDERLSI